MKKSIFFLLLGIVVFIGSPQAQSADDGQRERDYCVKMLVKIADPVLVALSKNELRSKMPVEAKDSTKKTVTHLEAVGRLLAGIAPWLELGPDATPEGKLREKYIMLAVAGIRNAVNPSSPDFLNFNKGRQPLVDAAFFAQALLCAPTQLWGRLDATAKANVLAALRSSRAILPVYSNWLMFSATVEAALERFDSSGDMMRIDYALRQHELWYKGDGVYGDGPEFHFDYYNSFVIQPMLLDVYDVIIDSSSRAADKTKQMEVIKRAKRYAEIQERLISPEGTFPAVGRSLAYRFGAFQLLSKMAQRKALPATLQPQQVRAALYHVIKRQIEMPGTFDNNGWLRIGFAGAQPAIGESYISTGSLYLCSTAFLMLGLPASDPFWQGPDISWTNKKIWSGQNVPAEHALY